MTPKRHAELLAGIQWLKRKYCMGPCGQSMSVLEARSRTERILRDLREAIAREVRPEKDEGK